MEFKENTDFDLISLGEVMLNFHLQTKKRFLKAKHLKCGRVNLTLYRGNARYSFGDSYKIARK